MDGLSSSLAVLTAMITPAVLISASGTMILSTSTRLGRVVDRVRSLLDRLRNLDHEARLEASFKLDRLVAQFFKSAREGGFSLGDVRASLSQWLEAQPLDHLLVIEPDVELRRILTAEIEGATGVDVRGISIDEVGESPVLTGAAPVALYGQAEAVGKVLPPGAECLFLHSTSVVERLKGERFPSPETLIVVVSRWPGFLKSSRAILIAAGLDLDAMDFRDARERGWKKALGSASLVITDSLMAPQLPAGTTSRVFRLISDASIAELRAFVEQRLR